MSRIDNDNIKNDDDGGFPCNCMICNGHNGEKRPLMNDCYACVLAYQQNADKMQSLCAVDGNHQDIADNEPHMEVRLVCAAIRFAPGAPSATRFADQSTASTVISQSLRKLTRFIISSTISQVGCGAPSGYR